MARYVDMAISIRVADVDKFDTGWRWRPGSDRELLRVGGVWDKRKRRWASKREKSVLVLRLHRGQERAARWLCEWLRRFATGDWSGIDRIWSALMIGGRRSGKTHLAVVFLVVFAVLYPKALEWVVSQTNETGDEADEALQEVLPRHWYTRKQAKTGRSTTYRLVNKSRILLKSGFKPENLKAGRVDVALINEAQEQSQSAYVKLRAPIADRGGIVLITSNPPERPIGRWVEDHFNKANAGEIEAIAFELDPRNNPIINYEALSSIEVEVDSKTYQRDVLGLFPPIGDTVCDSWTDRYNWIDPPSNFVDVTREVTMKELRRAYDDVIGCDFQKSAEVVGIVHRFYRDPDDPLALPLLWAVDEELVEADEHALLDQLEKKPRWRGRGPLDRYTGACCVVMDASAWWQDSTHGKGKRSDKIFRDREWRNLYRPQPPRPDGKDILDNPDVIPRFRLTNALLEAASGRRRKFVARHCVRTAEAFRKYEKLHGKPNGRSEFSHPVDGSSYVDFRMFSRTFVTATTGYIPVKRFNRREQMRGGPI